MSSWIQKCQVLFHTFPLLLPDGLGTTGHGWCIGIAYAFAEETEEQSAVAKYNAA
jgi:hypothetical protein